MTRTSNREFDIESSKKLCLTRLTCEEANLWMQMLTSMLNFAMASTELVKKIAGRFEDDTNFFEENEHIYVLLNEVKNKVEKIAIPKVPSICESNKEISSSGRAQRLSAKDTTETIFRRKQCSKLPIPIKKRRFKYSKELMEVISKSKQKSKDLLSECFCRDFDCIKDPCPCKDAADCADHTTGKHLPCRCRESEEKPKNKEVGDCNNCCDVDKDASLNSFDASIGSKSAPDRVNCRHLAELSGQLNQTEIHVNLLKEEVMRLTKMMKAEKKNKILRKKTAAALYREITKPQLEIQELVAEQFLDGVTPKKKAKSPCVSIDPIADSFLVSYPDLEEVPMPYIHKLDDLKQDPTALWNFPSKNDNLESNDHFYSCESDDEQCHCGGLGRKYDGLKNA